MTSAEGPDEPREGASDEPLAAVELVEGASENAALDEASARPAGPVRSPPRSVSETHLKSILESLVFASDKPLAVADMARIARAEHREVRKLLEELRGEYRGRGVSLDEVAGGWQFRSSAANAPFVRELLQAKPVKLSRAQVETLAIVAYRQPITRPEVDEVRGVDSGSALKVLLERELVRIMGRKEDVGRPVLYGTTPHFLTFFGLKSLKELPPLREFTDLTSESRETLVRELGDEPAASPPGDAAVAGAGEAAAPAQGGEPSAGPREGDAPRTEGGDGAGDGDERAGD